MYKNIIFDLGGVVVDFKPRDFLMDHFLNKSAEDEVFDLTFGSKEWEELDRGVISRGTANRLMLENAAERGRTFEVQAVIDEWQSILHTNKRTVKTMCKLKLAGYRLYYLSNIPQDVIDEIRQRDFFPLFDGGIASCEVHLSKPDPKIFGLMMQKYGLAYDETIFVDDTKVNAQAAYNLGITGILYKGPKSFQRALGLCGVKMEADNKRQAAPEAPTENRGGQNHTRVYLKSQKYRLFLCFQIHLR